MSSFSGQRASGWGHQGGYPPPPRDVPDCIAPHSCTAKMGSIKDRNGMDLTEAEGIKMRWQEYTEELYKKIFTTR